MAGYLIICLSLALFVQAKDVYPQLLLARLLFSLGGAAASTMVTAILPAVAAPSAEIPLEHPQIVVAPVSDGNGSVCRDSIASELTITPARFISRSSRRKDPSQASSSDADVASSTSRLAGFVGMFTGCGALIALMIFLPLPAKFQYAGVGEKAALQYSFYIVAAVAFLLAVWCFFGLRRLEGQPRDQSPRRMADQDAKRVDILLDTLRDMLNNFGTAFLIGFRRSDIAIGYLGGFVARASSVGVSLFIPLLVNAMFLSSGLCAGKESNDDPTGLPDIKRRCPHAYVVAAMMTGVAEMTALVFAPIFGYWMAKTSKKELPLLVASVAGIIGYPLFANQFDPDDTHTAERVTSFVAVCLIGVSQIGAIVCSLATLSKGVLRESPKPTSNGVQVAAPAAEPSEVDTEPLLANDEEHDRDIPLSSLKGSVAGVYSLYGGAAILILTKVGGLLFDKVSLAAPFYIMAVFNAILMVTCAVLTLWPVKPAGHQGNGHLGNVS